MPAIDITGVTKTYGSHVAVRDLSLSVPDGAVYGFIGPNGSGKSTTIRMIMRILLPDSGHIRVLGEETTRAANDQIGYLPEERGIYRPMKVRDLLEFHVALKGVRPDRQEIQVWLERFGLAEWAEKRVSDLSKGMAQKVQFLASIIFRPKLLILDEPFTGLDPVNAEVMRQTVVTLKKEGVTILFSTHDMNVAEKMCDQIFMIFKGRKVLDGTLEQIQDQYGADTVRIRMAEDGASTAELPGVSKVTDYGRFQELRLERGADSQQVLAALLRRGQIRLFELARPSLHDIFVRIAGPEAEENHHV